MRLCVETTEHSVIKALVRELDRVAANSPNAKTAFRVGFSGGSLLELLAEALPLVSCDLSKWHFYLCDERHVADDDEDSNMFTFKRKVFSRLASIGYAHLKPADTKLDLISCAANYEKLIWKDFGLTTDSGETPQFDLLLLGMGPDGHICSLFPEHKALEESAKLITFVDDSPKPPPKRITMTYRLINNAHVTMFAIMGANKAEMVERVFFGHDRSLPAARVNRDKMVLILDRAAGECIDKSKVKSDEL